MQSKFKFLNVYKRQIRGNLRHFFYLRQMKNVAIYVPENAVMQAIADPQYCFNAVNQFLAVSGKKPLFNVALVGLKKEVFINEGKFSIHTDKLLKEVKKNRFAYYSCIVWKYGGSYKVQQKINSVDSGTI